MGRARGLGSQGGVARLRRFGMRKNLDKTLVTGGSSGQRPKIRAGREGLLRRVLGTMTYLFLDYGACIMNSG